MNEYKKELPLEKTAKAPVRRGEYEPKLPWSDSKAGTFLMETALPIVLSVIVSVLTTLYFI